MTKASNTDNAWSETGETGGNDENNTITNFQDNNYNEVREDKNHDKRDERNNGYFENKGDDRQKYEGREDNMRNRYGNNRGRFEERRRYEPRDYDNREDRMMPRYGERRDNRFNDRRRFDTRGDNYGSRYEDRRYNDFRSNYRGGYDEGRYGNNINNRPIEYGRRVDYRRGNDGFVSSNYGMIRRNNYTNRTLMRQDDAPPNLTIALFNLKRDTLKEEFDNAVNSVLKDEIKTEFSTKIITDRNTGRCRGFGFVTFENLEDSIKAKQLLDGLMINGNIIRVAFSIEDNNLKEKIKEENKNSEIEEGELKKEKEESVEKNDD